MGEVRDVRSAACFKRLVLTRVVKEAFKVMNHSLVVFRFFNIVNAPTYFIILVILSKK